MLKNITNINYWDDTKIKSGEEWEKEINETIKKAKIAILLVSSDFFSSEYVWRKEFPEILKAADEGGTIILWIPIGACYYEITDVAKYQAVTDPKNPLENRKKAEQEEVYKDLTKRIHDILTFKYL